MDRSPEDGLRRLGPHLPGSPLRHPRQSLAGLGRPHDLGDPGPLHPRGGDGRRPGAPGAGVVRHPPALSAAPAARPGGPRRALSSGGRRPRRLPAALRRVPPGLPGSGLWRRAALAGLGQRGGARHALGRAPPVPLLLPGGRGGERVQRPAARLLLRRRLPPAPLGAPPALSRNRRGPASGRGRAVQKRGGAARPLGSSGRGRGPREAPQGRSGPRRRRPGRPRPGAPRLLALRHPQPVRRALRGSPDRREPLAGGRDAPAAPASQDPVRDGRGQALDRVLVRGAAPAPRGPAGIEETPGLAARPRGPRSVGGGLARLRGQRDADGAGADDLEPLPAPGLAPLPRAPRLRAGRSSSPLSLAAAGPGRTRQISVSQSR